MPVDGRGPYSVKYNGTVIGTFDLPGSEANPLLVWLNAQARLDGIQALVRAITFEHHSVAPAIASRTVRVTLRDGNNGTSVPAVKVIDPCFVSAGSEQWAMLRCDSPSSSGLVEIATPFSHSLGIDYLEPPDTACGFSNTSRKGRCILNIKGLVDIFCASAIAIM